MTPCFADDLQSALLDRQPFKFHHKLLGHPALSLDNLSRVLPTLPPQQVMYSKGLLDVEADFESTFRKKPKDRSLEETIESIRTRDSYIMVRSPEADPSFLDLYRSLCAEVSSLMQSRGVGDMPVGAQLYLFIASPNSVTPFHIDRYSTFLMQFRGSKTVTVAQPWDDNVVSQSDREAYVVRQNTKLPWSQQTDQLSTAFEFSPGEALHIPFVAGHHVRNGPEDVSISMSIIFNTRESIRWRDALSFNHVMRKQLQRVGMGPGKVGQSAWQDAIKSRMWHGYLKVRGFED
ncbi:cupin-like domain-containing protein [Aquabacterium sp.]|jgi:Cupin-like domain|uniref:cupin-like domain-containing protein n=1 Tax=Aquabacterium sp. TaxID=1872578 RepID=UPI002487636A|nr:cupin-like domain-containing protein [Aquabacterium sp.]MDI1349068.1 cupin-like domain-containing protein [Aquabacterium sp.]